MGTITRVGKNFRAGIMRRGVRYSKTFATRQQAIDWMAEVDEGVIDERGDSSKRSLVAAIDRYEASLAVQGKDDHAVVLRLNWLRGQGWASKPVRELDSETLSGWRDTRLKATSKRGTPIKPGTVLREMTLLRAVLEYTRTDLGWIDKNPLRDVKRPTKPPSRRRPISDTERDAVVAALGYTGPVESIRHECAVAFLLALETGMRAGEIVGLSWSRVDLKRRVVLLDKTKNGDQREVPLSKRAIELLTVMQGRKLIDYRRKIDKASVFHIDSASLDTTFRRARVAAGLAGFTFHDSRATALTRLATRLSVLELARMIGHRDVNSLMIYYAESASALAAKLDD